jgi:uncharacterized membrane protein (DUF106 family)
VSRERRPLDFYDGVLVLLAGLAGLFLWVALASIPIEETHELGNDATFDRILAFLSSATVITSILAVVLRRTWDWDRLKAQWRSERQLQQEMKDAQERGEWPRRKKG